MLGTSADIRTLCLRLRHLPLPLQGAIPLLGTELFELRDGIVTIGFIRLGVARKSGFGNAQRMEQVGFRGVRNLRFVLWGELFS